MDSFWIIFAAALPIYLALILGAGARLSGILNTEADQSLMRLTVNLLIPCLILKALLNNPVTTDVRTLLLAPALGFGGLLIGYALSGLAAKCLRLDLRQQRAFTVAVGTYNYGYIALPLVMALFGQQVLAVIFVFNFGVDLGFWTMGMMLLRGGTWRSNWQQMFSSPVLAVMTGVALNLSHLAPRIPDTVLKSLEFLGNCAVPLALILTGAIVCDFWKELNIFRQMKVTAVGVLLRLALIPGIFLSLAWALPMSIDLKRILVVQAAMPGAMLPIILTKLHGGDVELALRQVVVTSLIGFITIPIVIHLGLRFLGLNPLD